MNPKLHVARQITSHYRTTLSHTQVLEAIRYTYQHLNMPPHAQAYVHIPGGGIYSNCNLFIDEVGGLTFHWSVETEDVLTKE